MIGLRIDVTGFCTLSCEIKTKVSFFDKKKEKAENSPLCFFFQNTLFFNDKPPFDTDRIVGRQQLPFFVDEKLLVLLRQVFFQCIDIFLTDGDFQEV
jgi:hypothetical protein